MIAALAAVLTGIAAAAPEGPPTVDVVRAARQLVGGAVLAAADLEVDRVSEADVPDGAVSDPSTLIGRTLAAPVPRRQVLTTLALVTTRVGVARGHVLAPLRLADAEIVSLLRPGEVVDVVAADPQRAKASVVATAARIVTVPQVGEDSATADSGALVLIDVDSETAAALARAAVSATLTVIWR